MQDEAALDRISYELMEALNSDNVYYAEIRFSPILHTKNGITIEDALNAVQKGLNRGAKKYMGLNTE